MTILVVGDLVTDVVAVMQEAIRDGTDTDATVSIMGGGSAANTAAWLATRGKSVTLVAAVGDDLAGQQRIAEMEAIGVDCAVAKYPTVTGSIVVIADGTERTMLRDRGASAYLRPEDVDTALGGLPDAVHLHLSGYALLDKRTREAARYALNAAHAARLSTSVDAASSGPLRQTKGFLEWVRGVDLLFANQDEANVLVGDTPAEEQARQLASYVNAAIVKVGDRGAVWADSVGATETVPAEPVEAVDVTGAGDAFAAGALAAWLGGSSPREVLAAGSILGAIAVGQIGARPYR